MLALPAGAWKGSAYVGEVRSIRDEVRSVQLMYATPSQSSGLVISHLAPDPNPDTQDPLRLTEHLTSFISAFEPGFLVPRAKKGKLVAFAPKELVVHDEVSTINGQTTGVKVIEHRRLPLRAARVAVVRETKVVDLCVGGWNRGVMDVVPQLRPLDREIVRLFDLEGLTPPSE